MLTSVLGKSLLQGKLGFEYEFEDTGMGTDLQDCRKRYGDEYLSLLKMVSSNRHVEGCSTCRTFRFLQPLQGIRHRYLDHKPSSIRRVVSFAEIAADLEENTIDRIIRNCLMKNIEKS